MAKSTYKRCGSDRKFTEIIEFLHQQIKPVTAREIERALSIPAGTVMTKLAWGIDCRWVRQTGDGFEPGPAIAAMHAGYVHGLKLKITAQTTELNNLEV